MNQININIIRTVIILSLSGILFSGYLTYQKLFTGSCPLTEGCPILFGYPTCLYGFIIFLLLGIIASLYSFHPQCKNIRKNVMLVISIFGIIFSIYYSLYDFLWLECIGGKCTYSMILPSCVYGSLIYIAITFFVWNLKPEEINTFHAKKC